MTSVKTDLTREDAFRTPFGPNGPLTATNVQDAIEQAAALAASSAPASAEYLVASADATLSAERVATDTTTIDVDMGTAGQAKWNVLEVPGIAATGMVARTAAATYTARTLTGPAAGITVSNGNGVAGNPTLALANDLAALEALSSTGFAAHTGADAWAERTLTAPAAGLTISNPAGIAGNPTFALANDLAGVEGLAANGIATRTATDTWTVRTITGTTAELTVTNGDGVSGNPTISIPASVTFTGKTITGGTFSGPTISGSPTAAAATWANLGAVTTVDINGGTIDGTVIGGASAAAGTFAALVGTSLSVGTGGVATVGTIEVGAVSDTTISRNAAGIIQVEAVPLYSQIPQNSQSTAYTTVLTDAQKHILHPTADNNARTFTIAANASVAYPIGTCITFVNQINTVTIAITSDTLTLAGAGTTGSRTLAANGIATALKLTSTSWIISGTGLT